MGEISVHAKKLTVLAKSLRPLPIVKYKDGVAYDGFNDPEQKATVALIGDRREDVLAAHANGIACIGVGYGFESPGELKEAGCEHYAKTMADLKHLLLEQ